MEMGGCAVTALGAVLVLAGSFGSVAPGKVLCVVREGSTSGAELSHLEPQCQLQGHPQDQLQGHPQGRLQDHPQGRLQDHPQDQLQGHPQDQLQGHPQGQPQIKSKGQPLGRHARLLGHRLGFLTGLHLGGAISSSGSLSASHSLNVFGKVMNTALSVSYGPNGYYQGPGYPGVRPPLIPIAPGFGLQDDPGPTSTASPDKGHEAAAILGLASKESQDTAASNSSSHQNGQLPQRGGPLADPAVNEDPEEEVPLGENVIPDEEEVIGEESEPQPDPGPGPGLHFSAERRAQLEALAKVRVPTAEEQRKLFLQHHNKHITAFNKHYAKYNGDVSRVAIFSHTKDKSPRNHPRETVK